MKYKLYLNKPQLISEKNKSKRIIFTIERQREKKNKNTVSDDVWKKLSKKIKNIKCKNIMHVNQQQTMITNTKIGEREITKL